MSTQAIGHQLINAVESGFSTILSVPGNALKGAIRSGKLPELAILTTAGIKAFGNSSHVLNMMSPARGVAIPLASRAISVLFAD